MRPEPYGQVSNAALGEIARMPLRNDGCVTVQASNLTINRRNAMKLLNPTLAVAAIAVSAALSSVPVIAKDEDKGNKGQVTTRLSSYNEVHFSAGPPATLRGAISSKATGTFKAVIDDNAQEIHYELNYKDLESDVRQAHIHFGQRHTVGGIVVWLCQTGTNPAPTPAGALPVPTCVQDTSLSGAVTGTINAQNVLTVTGQGIAAGEFEELARAIRAGATYVNVHTAVNGPGEIRGQLRAPGEHRH
jgi:hypothetical protein